MRKLQVVGTIIVLAAVLLLTSVAVFAAPTGTLMFDVFNGYVNIPSEEALTNRGWDASDVRVRIHLNEWSQVEWEAAYSSLPEYVALSQMTVVVHTEDWFGHIEAQAVEQGASEFVPSWLPAGVFVEAEHGFTDSNDEFEVGAVYTRSETAEKQSAVSDVFVACWNFSSVPQGEWPAFLDEAGLVSESANISIYLSENHLQFISNETWENTLVSFPWLHAGNVRVIVSFNGMWSVNTDPLAELEERTEESHNWLFTSPFVGAIEAHVGYPPCDSFEVVSVTSETSTAAASNGGDSDGDGDGINDDIDTDDDNDGVDDDDDTDGGGDDDGDDTDTDTEVCPNGNVVPEGEDCDNGNGNDDDRCDNGNGPGCDSGGDDGGGDEGGGDDGGRECPHGRDGSDGSCERNEGDDTPAEGGDPDPEDGCRGNSCQNRNDD